MHAFIVALLLIAIAGFLAVICRGLLQIARRKDMPPTLPDVVELLPPPGEPPDAT